jgi:hypothetical protein
MPFSSRPLSAHHRCIQCNSLVPYTVVFKGELGYQCDRFVCPCGEGFYIISEWSQRRTPRYCYHLINAPVQD